ncbi:MAG TPA: MFS transporter [Pyrinomonadaceae bacterium]|jgi:predicted MFS family arabinose efflux permease
MPKNNPKQLTQQAFRFVLIIGIVNLFADMAYEGGRSITGPFLGSLGASATIIGFVAGFGELLGYSLRSISGYFADKTHRYWIVTFLGYLINVLVVPALALAGNWPLAAVLIIAERTGRAIRKPAVDAMISYAGKSIGRGWVFGLNEGLDQAGAAISPLIVALVLYTKGGYRKGFAVLLVPALLCLATLVIARISHPRPYEMEKEPADFSAAKGFPKAFWIYVGAGALIAAGFADFSLIAFHFQKVASVAQMNIPLFYAVAMGAGALTNLLFGRLFDRIGFPIIIFAFFIGALFAPLVFLGQFWLALVGMGVWGIGMGAQNSLLKAVLTGVLAVAKRSTGFGLFYTGYGVAWFLGSATMGFLYDKSISALIVFSVVSQLAALPVFFWGRTESKSAAS